MRCYHHIALLLIYFYAQPYVHFVLVCGVRMMVIRILSSRPHLQSQNVFDIDMFLCDSVDRDALPRPLHTHTRLQAPRFITILTRFRVHISVLMHHKLRQAVQILSL